MACFIWGVFMSILIIDDETEILSTLSKHLALAELDHKTASSPIEGIKLHEEHLFSTVLTDIRMPEMNGVDVIKNIKSINPASICFIMTGYGSLNNLLECLQLGAVEYFFKPFENMEYVVNHLKEAETRHERWKKELIKLRKTK